MMMLPSPGPHQHHSTRRQWPAWHAAAVAATPAAGRGLALQTCRSSTAAAAQQPYELLEERGVEFTPGRAFYRAESAQGRDLAVLAAAVYRQQHGQLRVLDVMAGSGMRGARYMQQAGADLVWANDYDRRNNTALVYNLVNALNHTSSSSSSSSSSGSSGSSSSGSSGSAEGATPGSSNSGGSGSNAGAVEAMAQQWVAAAEALKYEGMRGEVLQWQQQQQRQSHPELEPLQQAGGPADRVHTPQQQQRQQQDHGGAVEQPAPPQQQQQMQQQQQQQTQRAVRVTHVEARRLLSSVFLQEDYFDLVDVDSFGSDTSHLAAAIEALKFGGMLYLTSTDGMSAGGKRPMRSLAAYGCYARSLPSANEQGLRMLIGAAVREGAARGVTLTPLFSLYSYHGPVFRVMLRANRGREGAALQQYGFVGHCYLHGESARVGWRGLSQAWCRCSRCSQEPAAGAGADDAGVDDAGVDDAGAGGNEAEGSAVVSSQQSPSSRPTPLVLSGPMWTGPLHDTEFVSAMADLAKHWGWTGSAVPADSPYVVRQSKNNRQRPLEELLQLLVAESAPELPPWFVAIDTLAQHLNTTPSRDKLVAALQARGFTACCCHVEHRALRTNATTAQVLCVAVEDCGYSLRPTGQPGVPQVLLQRRQVEATLTDSEDAASSSSSSSGSSSSSSQDGGSSSSSSTDCLTL